jgi:DNA-binding response OmpR family regulator
VALRDPDSRDAVRSALAEAGLSVRLALARGEGILDALRGQTGPVLCLLPRDGAPSPAEVLEHGADDVLREPVSTRELVARVKAVLRGYERSKTPPVLAKLGPIVVDRNGKRALVRGRRVALTRSELELLGSLIACPGRVFRRDELLVHVLADGKRATPRLIDTHMVSLRRKLGAAGEWIETIRGYGYRARTEEA